MAFQDDFYTNEDIARLSANDLLRPEVLAQISNVLTHAWYQSQSGKAYAALEAIQEKLAATPRSLMPEDVSVLLFEIECIVAFSALPFTSPEEVQEYMQTKVRVAAYKENLQLSDVMPRLVRANIGFPDLLLRWLGSAAQGLRAGEQEIGNSRIQTFDGKVVAPTIGAWVQDYERYAENHPADGSVMIAEYMTKSPNMASLEEDDKAALRKLFSWFNILQFDQGPALTVSSQNPAKLPQRQTLHQAPAAATDDNEMLPSVQPAKKIVQTRAPAAPKQKKAATQRSAEEQLLTSLHNSRNLVERYERAEKDLPPAGPHSVNQVAQLSEKVLRGEEKSGRVIAGIFQIVRARGLQALLTNPAFINTMRTAMAPALQTQLRLTEEQAIHVTDLPANRIVVLKEFFKLLFGSATGSESDAARLMVHVASIVPETLAGPEASFAYFDLGDQHFHWALTEVRSTDGVLRNRIP